MGRWGGGRSEEAGRSSRVTSLYALKPRQRIVKASKKSANCLQIEGVSPAEPQCCAPMRCAKQFCYQFAWPDEMVPAAVCMPETLLTYSKQVLFGVTASVVCALGSAVNNPTLRTEGSLSVRGYTRWLLDLSMSFATLPPARGWHHLWAQASWEEFSCTR